MKKRKARAKVVRIKKVRPGWSLQKLIVTTGTVITMFLGLIIVVQAGHYSRLKSAVADGRQRLEQQEDRNEQVRGEIERLHDQEYIELLARKYLGLVKPGEIVFQLND